MDVQQKGWRAGRIGRTRGKQATFFTDSQRLQPSGLLLINRSPLTSSLEAQVNGTKSISPLEIIDATARAHICVGPTSNIAMTLTSLSYHDMSFSTLSQPPFRHNMNINPCEIVAYHRCSNTLFQPLVPMQHRKCHGWGRNEAIPRKGLRRAMFNDSRRAGRTTASRKTVDKICSSVFFNALRLP